MNTPKTKQLYFDSPKAVQNEDLFQRYEFAKRIAEIVAAQSSKTSLVVGLYGKWGEGKSSVLNFIESELPKDTVIVKFNPWLYSNENHVLNSFFSSIALALDEQLAGTKQKIGEFLETYSGLIGAFTQFLGAGTDGVKDIGSRMKETTVEKVRDKINQMILSSGKKIVVFIDDIDRLDANEIQFIFKLVKLTADFPNSAYILAFDEEMVANALAPRYGSGKDKNAGYLFLDKIIQVPLKLPKISRQVLRKYSLELIKTVVAENEVPFSESEEKNFTEWFNNAIAPQLDNPRAGLRYANSLSFSIPMLKGEVDITDLMIIEGVKIFYPELYDFMRTHPDMFLKSADGGRFGQDRDHKKNEHRIKEIDEVLSRYGDSGRIRLKELLCELFPQLTGLYKNVVPMEDDYKKDIQKKRLCSSSHFQRYFSYVVQKGDVSDVYLTEFFDVLESQEVSQIVEKFREAFELFEAGDFLWTLLYWDTGLSQRQTIGLALAIYRNPELLPQANDGTARGSVPWMLLITIAKAFFRLSSEIRYDFLQQVISTEVDLNYAMELTVEMQRLSDKSYGDDKIPSVQFDAIHQTLVTRFKKELKGDNFFSLVDDYKLQRILLMWKVIDAEEMWAAIRMELQRSSDGGLKFLKVFVPTVTSFSVNGQVTFKATLFPKHYQAISDIIDPEILFVRLMDVYDCIDIQLDMDKLSEREAYTDHQLIYQFQQRHMSMTMLGKP